MTPSELTKCAFTVRQHRPRRAQKKRELAQNELKDHQGKLIMYLLARDDEQAQTEEESLKSDWSLYLTDYRICAQAET